MPAWWPRSGSRIRGGIRDGGVTRASCAGRPLRPTRAARAARGWLGLVVLLALLGGRPALVAGQTAGDSLRVFLVTIGAGEAVWQRFGHDALWIHDPMARTDRAYHWGLFDMDEAGFLANFLQGRMFYRMGEVNVDRLIAAERGAGRSATIQELALTTDQARELQTFVEWNMRPENRRYRYDYFRDNCSTRVRDALDRVLDGAIRDRLTGQPTSLTYRSQAIALTADDPLLSNGMDLGLGPLSDQPITRWELAYIPMRLSEDVATMTVDRGGRAIPLVVGSRTLAGAGPPAPVERAPSPGLRALIHLLVGVLVGGLVAGLAIPAAGATDHDPDLAGDRADGPGRTASRWVLAVAGSAWGLVVGVLGIIVLGLWLFTDHEFAWNNENVLQVSPLALAFVVLVPRAVIRHGSKWATRLAGLLAALSLLGLMIHPLPVTRQANLAIIALLLPVHLGMLYAMWRLENRGATAG